MMLDLKKIHTPASRACMKAARGFSLVEILVVITIMALLVALVATSATTIMENSKVTACSKNLKEIGTLMVLMKNERRSSNKRGWPKKKGIQFLLELTRGGKTGKFAYASGNATKIFICPNTDDINRTDEDDTPGSAYFDIDNVDTMSISYAGRNQVDFPIEKDPKREDAIIASDDNEGRPNHKIFTNYVTIGPVVDKVDIRDFLEDFPELEELGYLPIGPDSPYDDFRKLMVDY